MGTLCFILPLTGHVGGGPSLPTLPTDPGYGVGRPLPPVATPPIYLPPVYPTWGPLPPSRPVDPGWSGGTPLPPHIPIYPGSRPPVDPGWVGGTPLPPHIWWRPEGPVDPGYVGGFPLPPFARPPIYYPPVVGGGPMPPQPPNVIWPQPPPPNLPPTPPDKPQAGIDPIPIGDTGWYLDYWRGAGWVLVPPGSSQLPPTAQPK